MREALYSRLIKPLWNILSHYWTFFFDIFPKAYQQLGNFDPDFNFFYLTFFTLNLLVVLYCAVSVFVKDPNSTSKSTVNLSDSGSIRTYWNSSTHLAMLVGAIALVFPLVNNFISLAFIFVALNIVLYGLMLRDSLFSADATLKYFALGAAATVLLFIGIFLHVFSYGSVEYSTIGFLLSRVFVYSAEGDFLTWVHVLAFICVLTAFLFKLGVYPYHYYLVDIYEGVRLETLAVITVPVKIATYFALLNYIGILSYLQGLIQPLFIFVGFGSVLSGSFGAYLQPKLRSFWAYSYISSMGFVFLGFQYSLSGFTTFPATFYFVTYIITWLGILVFFVLVVLKERSQKFKFVLSELRYVSQLTEISALGTPVHGFFQLLLLSLAGIPPSLGFFAKFFILANCFSSWASYIILLFLLLILPLNTYNYLRLVQMISFQTRPVRLYSSSAVILDSNTYWLSYMFFAPVLVVFAGPVYLAGDDVFGLGDVFIDLFRGVGLASHRRGITCYIDPYAVVL